MLNVKPFLVRFARSAVPEPAKPTDDLQDRGKMPDPPPPPQTINTRVQPETTDEN